MPVEQLGILGGYNAEYDEATRHQGDMARYRGLQALSQMMMPQGSPMAPQGPQANPPMMPPQGGPPMAGGSPGGGMPPGGGPPMGGVPGGGMPPPGGPPGMQPPGGGGMPPGGGMQQPPGGGFQTPGQGPLDWRMAIQAIQKANPGAPPNVLAAAMDGMIPLMNADSQQQWRLIREQIMQQAVNQKPQIVAMQQGGANWRATLSAKTRKEIAALSDETKRELFGEAEEGRNTRAQLSADTRTDIAQDTEAGRNTRAEASLGERTRHDKEIESERTRGLDIREKQIHLSEARLEWQKDKGLQELDLKRQALEERIKSGKDKTAITQWRAIVDAQHKRMMEIIQSHSANVEMTAEEKKELKQEADKMRDDAIAGIRGATGSSTPTGGTTTTTGPKVEGKVPPNVKEGQPKQIDREAAKKAGYTDAEIDAFEKGK